MSTGLVEDIREGKMFAREGSERNGPGWAKRWMEAVAAALQEDGANNWNLNCNWAGTRDGILVWGKDRGGLKTRLNTKTDPF